MPDAWPADLPQCFLAGSRIDGIGDPRLRSQPDTGPSLVRARSSAMADPLAGQMKLTAAQWDTLKTFGATTLIGWSLPFTFPHTDGVLVRFSDALPSKRRIGAGAYMVDLKLEVLP